jgi:putative DNA primase/helicase
MPTVADVARIWQQAGVSVIPILANSSKRPAFRWSPYQVSLPTLAQIDQWWGEDEEYGLALVCGPISGNLEMCEIEGRALAKRPALLDIINRMDEGGAGPIWDLLTGPDGYAEDSPSGGMHLLYRITDHPVPGNTKIASAEDRVCLAETRGHGGYVIVAPTGGKCHPTGEPWLLVNGTYGKLPSITWAERNLLHECLRVALDQTPPAPAPVNVPVVVPALGSMGLTASVVGSVSPGDAFERETDWADILEPHGWTLTQAAGLERQWVRPGKNPRDGISATTGRANDRDRLYVFSTSTEFEAEKPYTKFGAYALLNFGGDHSLAARHLARNGYGERRVSTTTDIAEWEPPAPVTENDEYTEDDIGNGLRLANQVRDTYRYIWEEKTFYRWDGRVWIRDVDSGISREWTKVTEAIRAGGNAKWATKCRTVAKLNGAITFAKGNGLTFSATEWAPDRSLLNVTNGVLDLKTQQLHRHDPHLLMTQTMGTAFDPEAACPNFEQFIADALPSPEIRAYVQRALGYSLLGDADQRSIFLIYGPSGTGKSTLIETMRDIFGTYGVTAGSGAFRASPNVGGPQADLHSLRGRRFVTTSETAENASFDEDLLKRLSGRDRVTSRSLYQEPVEWVPECVLWVATNNPPKFNSDDDAIWRRTKLIPFTTVFRGEGEIPDFARKVLVPEAAGILNWLLAGLRDFLAHGLQEPAEVEELAVEQRRDSDSVARFLQDRMVDGLLVESEGGTVGCAALYDRYLEWAKQVGEKAPLGNRRFGLRVMSLSPGVHRDQTPGTRASWIGLAWVPGFQIPLPGWREFPG